jgi:hypothetical protein
MCDGALTQMAKNKGGPATIHFSNPPAGEEKHHPRKQKQILLAAKMNKKR